MRAPDLTRLLTLEARDDAPDGGGGVAARWVRLGAHWAEVRPGSAVE
ncbi:MAG: phage tail protein, partial [Rhodobacterales bacterium CG18_big_fil_WC_8_21_14_2_50_71_9]